MCIAKRLEKLTGSLALPSWGRFFSMRGEEGGKEGGKGKGGRGGRKRGREEEEEREKFEPYNV